MIFRGQWASDTQPKFAAIAPGQFGGDAQCASAGGTNLNRGQAIYDTQRCIAAIAPGQIDHDAQIGNAGGTNSDCGRQITDDAQDPRATAEPGHDARDAQWMYAGLTLSHTPRRRTDQ